MLVTGVAGLTFTVTRGAEGSTAATHANAAAVTHVLTAGALGAISTDHTALTDPHSGKYPALSLVTAKGDLLVGTGSGAMIGVPAGANDTVLVADSAQVSGVKWGSGVTGPTGATGATGATGSTGATGAQGSAGLPGTVTVSGAPPYICIQDQKTQNTAGGSFTSGAWRTRTLNTIVADSASLATLASNQITLPPGTYRCAIRPTVYQVNQHQARLQNITAAATVLVGTTEQSGGAQNNSGNSLVVGRFLLRETSVLEVQHQCTTTNGTNGFGVAANFTTEVYTVAEFWLEGGAPPFFGVTVANPPLRRRGLLTDYQQHSLNTPPQ